MSAYLAAACRSAVAPRDGALSALSLHELGAPVITAVLAQAGLAGEDVDELIVSNALGAGGNPARVLALAAGLPERVAGLSIDRQCAGGLDAVVLARQMVLAGAADVVVAGGVESYSRRPLRLRRFADGRPPEAYEQAPFTPWPDRDPDMAEAAQALGAMLGISREEQDTWAMASHAKARAHVAAAGEITPVAGLTVDAFTRDLRPALCRRAKVLTGDITTANTAVAADGAGFVVVVSNRVSRHLHGPTIKILGGATRGGTPDMPGLAPVAAIEHVLASVGRAARDLQAAEVMEAYAVQAIACVRGAGIDPQIVNTGGGALARGHPVGASGAINAVRLYHTLCRTGGTGLAAIAAAGGIGTALLLSA
ncbi:acetyl-CoA acetyltransferase [Sulfitobacter sp. EhC04]|uniref:thiolase family protein n=1 Tax=Sulfitobacter sp. EhC04 TaxID=1849168 RepID=UPI0007F40B05|nr:thiolase family protein [Sulfitobacter sp. EhC04]OAN71857.1 acetyl-CoA acetyltransferase [Sulfitobacter sp. EhC04]